MEDIIQKMIGDCRIEKRLGQGGMGSVYLAHNINLDIPVAIKILDPSLANSEEIVKRFFTEARSAARLDSPHIVEIKRVGQDQGHYFIEMEFVEGENLRDKLRREAPVTYPTALQYLYQICLGLAEAHKAGIVHRDIKPENILVNTKGIFKIADFGLAKVLKESSFLTQAGQLLGTPYYLAPEQCEGKSADARSDIYSLGVTFYFMITGKLPFAGDSVLATLAARLHSTPPTPRSIIPQIPEDVENLTLKMMARELSDRFQNIMEVLKELGRLIKRYQVPLPWLGMDLDMPNLLAPSNNEITSFDRANVFSYELANAATTVGKSIPQEDTTPTTSQKNTAEVNPIPANENVSSLNPLAIPLTSSGSTGNAEIPLLNVDMQNVEPTSSSLANVVQQTSHASSHSLAYAANQIAIPTPTTNPSPVNADHAVSPQGMTCLNSPAALQTLHNTSPRFAQSEHTTKQRPPANPANLGETLPAHSASLPANSILPSVAVLEESLRKIVPDSPIVVTISTPEMQSGIWKRIALFTSAVLVVVIVILLWGWKNKSDALRAKEREMKNQEIALNEIKKKMKIAQEQKREEDFIEYLSEYHSFIEKNPVWKEKDYLFRSQTEDQFQQLMNRKDYKTRILMERARRFPNLQKLLPLRPPAPPPHDPNQPPPDPNQPPPDPGQPRPPWEHPPQDSMPEILVRDFSLDKQAVVCKTSKNCSVVNNTLEINAFPNQHSRFTSLGSAAWQIPSQPGKLTMQFQFIAPNKPVHHARAAMTLSICWGKNEHKFRIIPTSQYRKLAIKFDTDKLSVTLDTLRLSPFKITPMPPTSATSSLQIEIVSSKLVISEMKFSQ